MLHRELRFTSQSRLPFSVRWHAAEAFFTTVLQNQGNRFGKIAARIVLGPALPIGAWNIRSIGDIPLAIPFEDSHKFIVHPRFPAIYDTARAGPMPKHVHHESLE
jgi:hypothetical protein